MMLFRACRQESWFILFAEVDRLSLLMGVSATTLLRSSLNGVQAILVLFAVTLFSALPARSEDLALRIDQYLKTRVANNQFSVKVLVARGDDVLIRREYDQSGRNHGSVKNDVVHRFPVGTIAEQFVAAAVLQLEEQGKIRIDASICSYVSSCPSDWRDIEVVHLLTHTSGLPSLKQPSSRQKKLALPHTLRGLLAAVDGESLQFKPGSMFKYNPLDFLVLYFVIGNVTGKLPKEYIETAVFRPLSMTDTKYPTSEQFSTKVPKSHLQDGKSQTIRESRFCEDNVCSTVEDLYRWDRALTKETVISHDSLLQMFTPYRDGYGLGWKITKEFNKRLALQSGRAGGISVSLRLYPDDDTCIVLVANGSSNVDSVELTHDIAAILFGRGYPASKSATTAPILAK